MTSCVVASLHIKWKRHTHLLEVDRQKTNSWENDVRSIRSTLYSLLFSPSFPTQVRGRVWSFIFILSLFLLLPLLPPSTSSSLEILFQVQHDLHRQMSCEEGNQNSFSPPSLHSSLHPPSAFLYRRNFLLEKLDNNNASKAPSIFCLPFSLSLALLFFQWLMS